MEIAISKYKIKIWIQVYQSSRISIFSSVKIIISVQCKPKNISEVIGKPQTNTQFITIIRHLKRNGKFVRCPIIS